MADFQFYDERQDLDQTTQFLSDVAPPVPQIAPVSWAAEVLSIDGSNTRTVLAARYGFVEKKIVESVEEGRFYLSELLVVRLEGAEFVIRDVLLGDRLQSSGNVKQVARHRALQGLCAVLTPVGTEEVSLPMLANGDDGHGAMTKQNASSDALRVGHRQFRLSGTAAVPVGLAIAALTLAGAGVRRMRNAGCASRYIRLKELTPAEAAKWRESQTAAPTTKKGR